MSPSPALVLRPSAFDPRLAPSVSRGVLRPFVLTLLFSACAAAAVAQPLPLASPESQGVSSERLARLHAMLERHVAEKKHAGIVCLIARHGRIIDWQTYGSRDLGMKLPMEKDTIVRIFSMSKVISSVAVMILVEEGRLRLDDPVGKYLPALAKMKVFAGGSAKKPKLVDASREITIKDLLTHTSGLIYGFGTDSPINQIYRSANLMESPSMDAFVAKVATLPLAHQPGARFSYGVSIDVLGAVVEKVSGMPFERFVEERITRPLGMIDTGYDVPDAKRSRLGKVYTLDKENALTEVPQTQLAGVSVEPGKGFAAGGAGMFSTIGDCARFGQMLLNKGELDGVRVLGPKTVELMMANHLSHLTPPTTQMPSGTGYSTASEGFGLGGAVRIDLATGDTPGSIGQFGWSGAATTYFNIDPQEQTIALVFAQHFPFNQHGLFWQFSTLMYAALVE